MFACAVFIVYCLFCCILLSYSLTAAYTWRIKPDDDDDKEVEVVIKINFKLKSSILHYKLYKVRKT